jgi:hypothetical protein
MCPDTNSVSDIHGIVKSVVVVSPFKPASYRHIGVILICRAILLTLHVGMTLMYLFKSRF